jgi:hypothetical protein
MTTWDETLAAAPELAAKVEARFRATSLGFLATIRADGAPRIGGQEALFWAGELWLGMMWESWKARDLRRDPRCSFHAASADKDVKEGDARVSGRAVEVDDDEVKRGMGAAVAEEHGFDPSQEGPFHLFRLDVTELMHLQPAGDHLIIESWTPTGGLQRIERR